MATAEREPTPEIDNPMKFECGNCGNNEITTKQNTTLYMYEKDQGKNHLKTECFARPGYITVHFLDYTDTEQEIWASQFDYAVDESGNIPETCEDEALIAVWKDHYGIKAVAEYELTGSQKKKCDWFKYLLETMPDEEIQAEFAKPMPKKQVRNIWQ